MSSFRIILLLIPSANTISGSLTVKKAGTVLPVRSTSSTRHGTPITKKTIFTSFGGEPYKLPMYLILRTIADQRKDLFFDVFYTGPVLPESSDNFVSHGYVPNLYEHLAVAKIAIVHGGLTTLHEALLFEKPVLIIMDPDHPEQQNNARKIVDMGAGTSVDGRRVTLEMLEKKIAETMILTPTLPGGPCCNQRQEKCNRYHYGSCSPKATLISGANLNQYQVCPCRSAPK